MYRRFSNDQRCLKFNLVQYLISKVREVFTGMIIKVGLQKFLVKLHRRKKEKGWWNRKFEDA